MTESLTDPADLPPGLTTDPARRAAAVPVRLLTKAEAEGAAAGRRAAKLLRFDGSVGQVVADEEGVLVGIGEGEEPLALGAAAARLAAGDYRLEGAADAHALGLHALAWAMGAYRFERYKSGGPVPTLVLDEDVDAAAVARDARAVRLARDLVNTPAEDMTPAALADAAAQVAKAHDAQVEVISGDVLREGFPLVHTVGRAAAATPRLVDLRWGTRGPKVTLVGKGVCFDSGGLNVKGATGMALMKKDMGGAANALALAQSVMEAGLDIQLRLLIPAVENAIGGNAFRPGDVYRARDGQTVEISNTDAEGRLILADALAYAGEDAPDRIVSLATLTGAARVALGPDLAPVYSTDEAFRDRVIEEGARRADPCWPMPFWDRYDEYLKSDIADVNHASTNSFAGSVTAALFLRRFVGTVPYTHLDIYAWVPSARPGRPQGGEAIGVRALFGALASEAG